MLREKRGLLHDQQAILSKAVKGRGSGAFFRVFRVLRHSSRARMTASFDDKRYRYRRFTVTGRDVNCGIHGSTLPSRRKLTVGEKWERFSALEGRAELSRDECEVPMVAGVKALISALTLSFVLG